MVKRRDVFPTVDSFPSHARNTRNKSPWKETVYEPILVLWACMTSLYSHTFINTVPVGTLQSVPREDFVATSLLFVTDSSTATSCQPLFLGRYNILEKGECGIPRTLVPKNGTHHITWKYSEGNMERRQHILFSACWNNRRPIPVDTSEGLQALMDDTQRGESSHYSTTARGTWVSLETGDPDSAVHHCGLQNLCWSNSRFE